jgi:hypothetical protein
MAYWAAIQANQKYTITENVLTRYTSTNFAICGGSLVLVNSKEISLDLRVFTTPPEKHKQMSRIRAISSVHPKGLFRTKRVKNCNKRTTKILQKKTDSTEFST